MTSVSLRFLATARDGATAVEFALVVPMFFMLVFGAIEFGRVLWTKQALQQTAIAGARCMAIAQASNASQNTGSCASSGAYSSSNTNTYIENVASGWGLSLTASNISLNTSVSSGGCAGLSQVTLTSTFNSVVPQIVQLAAGGTTLTATACYPNNS
jgi:Flp pilus assembly protein TadG